MLCEVLAVIIIILVLILLWNVSRMNVSEMVFYEKFNPGFNPVYNRTFHQAAMDHQSDYLKDMRGMTSDDYSLENTLYNQHAARKEINSSNVQA